jgi:hypothetical protein
MRNIKLMPDYGCFPLWEASAGAVGNIDPRTLPLSVGLTSELEKWAEQYDATLDVDNPLSSGFTSSEHERDFADVGRRLCTLIQQELGHEFSIFLQV